MSDWYSNALARARGQAPPPQQAAPSAGYAPSPGVARWQGDRQVSQQTVNQEQLAAALGISEDMIPPQIRWAQKLTNAARAAVTNGEAHRTDTEPCPRCGSNQFFSRASGNKRMPPPAPHCYNCGYNDGMFEQGLATSWNAN